METRQVLAIYFPYIRRVYKFYSLLLAHIILSHTPHTYMYACVFYFSRNAKWYALFTFKRRDPAGIANIDVKIDLSIYIRDACATQRIRSSCIRELCDFLGILLWNRTKENRERDTCACLRERREKSLSVREANSRKQTLRLSAKTGDREIAEYDVTGKRKPRNRTVKRAELIFRTGISDADYMPFAWLAQIRVHPTGIISRSEILLEDSGSGQIR